MFVLEGEGYHKIKAKLKRLFKEHGLVWEGNFDRQEFTWFNGVDKVVAEFDKDMSGDTIEARIIFKGSVGSPFYEALKKFLLEHDAIERQPTSEHNKELVEKLKKQVLEWELIYKPDFDAMKRRGIPDTLLKIKVDTYQNERATFIKSLVD